MSSDSRLGGEVPCRLTPGSGRLHVTCLQAQVAPCCLPPGSGGSMSPASTFQGLHVSPGAPPHPPHSDCAGEGQGDQESQGGWVLQVRLATPGSCRADGRGSLHGVGWSPELAHCPGGGVSCQGWAGALRSQELLLTWRGVRSTAELLTKPKARPKP